MPAIYFHDMPVYRLPHDAYYASREQYVADVVADAFRNLDSKPEAVTHLRESVEQHDYERYGPWLFNEIIGYVRLHFVGSQIRGEYFAVDRKRVTLNRCKTFIYRTHKLAPEHHLPSGATNEQILRLVMEYVDACKKEEPRRYFDDSWLKSIGPAVDWNEVLRSNA